MAIMKPALMRWLEALVQVGEDPGSMKVGFQRVLHPRGLPLNGDGFIRHMAIGPVQRPGQPPEQMALMSYFMPPDQQNGIQAVELGRDLGALITFLVNRRIDVLDELALSMEDRPNEATFMPLSGMPDRVLLAPMEIDQPRLDAVLREYLGLLMGLAEKDAEVMAAAMDMHYGACLLFDRDLGSAYTLLVAGVEAMSRRFGRPPRDWSAWEDADKWDRVFEENGLAEAQVEALRKRLMRDKHLRLSETFAEYAGMTLPDSFWEGERRDWTYGITMPEGAFTGVGNWHPGTPIDQFVPRDRDQLKATLRRSYAARSGYVHSGSRIGDPTAELFRTRATPTEDQRLSFPGLRLLLRALIDHEIRARSTGHPVVPDITLTLDTTSPAQPAMAARWTTPRPGARADTSQRRRRRS